MKRAVFLALAMVMALALPCLASRTMFRTHVRVSKVTYRAVTDAASRDWDEPVTEAVFAVASGDTVRFMPVMPNPYTAAPDTISYRGTSMEVACLSGSVTIRPFGPYFRPGLRIGLSASADSVLYRWKATTLVDSVWVWRVGGTARCLVSAH